MAQNWNTEIPETKKIIEQFTDDLEKLYTALLKTQSISYEEFTAKSKALTTKFESDYTAAWKAYEAKKAAKN